jgi:glutamyl-tRNA synthetase
MHLGNLRTALFSYLAANPNPATGGQFLLRIEDTDLARSTSEFVQTLLQDLKWLGLMWQEGPEQDLGHGPYFQSQREAIYANYYQQLLAKEQAYYCFCSEAQLALRRRQQLSAGYAPRYAGTCRHLSSTQIEQYFAQGLVPTIRFRIPTQPEIRFNDLVQGAKHFNSADLGDFIIRKADNSAAFMFCNAVDDALMGVNLVLRGEDHLTNTPRQILILQALELPIPNYAHMALILGHDGKPLSKRNGSQAIAQLRAQGYLPGAILNYLARLGHSLEVERLLPLTELAIQFEVARLSSSPARFDVAQLNFWQKEAIMQQSEANLWDWMAPTVAPWVPAEKQMAFTTTVKDNLVQLNDAKLWAQQLFGQSAPLSQEAREWLITTPDGFFETAARWAQQHPPEPKPLLAQLKAEFNLKGKALFMPIRVALTGLTYGPELNKLFPLLGQTALSQRFTQALNLSTDNA